MDVTQKRPYYRHGPDREHVRSIAIDLILTVFTFGLFNLYIQYRQMLAVNDLLREDKYSFLKWALFTLVTFGLYHIYHEYRMSQDLARLTHNPHSHEPIIGALITAFGFHPVLDAIQQTHINRLFGGSAL